MSRWSKTISLISIGILLPLGYYYPPWLGWALVLYFFGRKHPQIYDDYPIDWRRKCWAVAALVIFVLCFMVAPLRY